MSASRAGRCAFCADCFRPLSESSSPRLARTAFARAADARKNASSRSFRFEIRDVCTLTVGFSSAGAMVSKRRIYPSTQRERKGGGGDGRRASTLGEKAGHRTNP